MDSGRPLLVWEPPSPVPAYYFPEADVRMDLLRPRPAGDSDRRIHYDLELAGRRVEQAAWSYPDPDPEHAPLRGHVALRWPFMDAWFEEDDEVFVHPRDPYTRVDILSSSRQIRVELDGHALAESNRPRLLFETGLPTRYYLPKLDLRAELLVASDHQTSCPYKGTAGYYSVRLGDRVHENLAWYYPRPIPEAARIENLVAFFNEKVDIFVDGELQARPRTGWS